MNSDVMHRRVQDGQMGHQQNSNAEGQNFDGARKRTLVKPSILQQLVPEVKETVATDVDFPKQSKTSFGIVNLWNIRRNGRYAGRPRQKARIVTGISY